MHSTPGGRDSVDIDRHLELGRLAYSLGFDSLFVFEHHFTDYILSPSPLVTLAYFAGALPGAILGTSVILLSAYDDRRLAEDLCVLDNMARGNLVIGVGSGRSDSELLRLGTTRERASEEFPERVGRLYDILAEAGQDGHIRPRPAYSPHKRVFTASGRRISRPDGGYYPVS
ncbi:MAG: LLM class flavin-dependent oxidoreductase [Microthrixaceae bacterium]